MCFEGISCNSCDPAFVPLITRILSIGGKFEQLLMALRISGTAYRIRVAQTEESASTTRHRSLRFASLICGLISSGRSGSRSFSSSIRNAICFVNCFKESKLETRFLNDSGELIVEISN